MSTLKTLLANMRHAVHCKMTSPIGGGIFSHAEISEALQEIEALQHQKENSLKDIHYLGGLGIGIGMGLTGPMPHPAVIGVGLITAAENLIRLNSPEEIKDEDAPRTRAMVSGIISSWADRRRMASRAWTSAELIERGFNAEHLGEGYLYRLDEDGNLEYRDETWDPLHDWGVFDAMASIGEAWAPTLEAVENWLNSHR